MVDSFYEIGIYHPDTGASADPYLAAVFIPLIILTPIKPFI
jgi:hypothetical protein